MTRWTDLADDTFPHGTVDGYRMGCKSAACPALLACRDVYTRYHGDYTFAKQVDAGVPLEVILTAEQERAAERIAADKAAARAERDRARAATHRKAARKTQTPRATAGVPVDRDQLAALHAQGLTDYVIAQRMGRSRSSIAYARRALGLPTAAEAKHEGRAVRIRRMHTAGATDQQIAVELGVPRHVAADARRYLGLPTNHEPRPARSAPRKDRRADVTRLHAEGLSDRQIADRLHASPHVIADTRRRLHLPPNHEPRARRNPALLQPHGTNACFTRGCRRPECVEAHHAYHRAYSARRRASDAGAYHGTAYGYQLGCHDRATCPATPTCADASLNADKARRRAAGIPERVMVDAAPVRAHIASLHHAGLTYAQVAERAGVPPTAVRHVMCSRGAGRPRVEQLLAGRAAAILGLPIPERRAA